MFLCITPDMFLCFNEEFTLLHIFIDADSCPVKEEVYRVAKRCELDVTLVANTWMRIPNDPRITLEIVAAGPDVADDWIVEQIQENDIVVTNDIPLADRCIKKGACAIKPTGKIYTEESIGDALATRDLMTELRSAGVITGGPPPLKKCDRSLFLQQLDNVIQSIRRKYKLA